MSVGHILLSQIKMAYNHSCLKALLYDNLSVDLINSYKKFVEFY